MARCASRRSRTATRGRRGGERPKNKNKSSATDSPAQSFFWVRGVKMEALVALASSRLGVDGAACVALALHRVRRHAAERVQAAARGLLARVRVEWQLVHMAVGWFEASAHAPPVDALESRSMYGQLIDLRRAMAR